MIYVEGKGVKIVIVNFKMSTYNSFKGAKPYTVNKNKAKSYIVNKNGAKVTSLLGRVNRHFLNIASTISK